MPMKDSRMTDDWIASVVNSNPIHIADKTKNIITCPVRLAYANLVKPAKPMDGAGPDAKPSYNTALLFPALATPIISSVMVPMWLEMVRREFPTNIGADGNPLGLYNPFRDQSEKQNQNGFTAGCIFLSSVGTHFKPQIVDSAMNPIVDENRIYSGVWAIVAISMFVFGKSPSRPKKGVTFGLQTVMLFADDTNVGGQGGDPKSDFAGIKIDNAFQPAAAFGNTPAAAPQIAPQSILPVAQPVSAGVPAAPPLAPGKFW